MAEYIIYEQRSPIRIELKKLTKQQFEDFYASFVPFFLALFSSEYPQMASRFDDALAIVSPNPVLSRVCLRQFVSLASEGEDRNPYSIPVADEAWGRMITIFNDVDPSDYVPRMWFQTFLFDIYRRTSSVMSQRLHEGQA